jgi:hypothetical protein
MLADTATDRRCTGPGMHRPDHFLWECIRLGSLNKNKDTDFPFK